MERTDLYFAHKYELNPVTYCVRISDVGRSDIREIVKDTENCRISIYGHIHGKSGFRLAYEGEYKGVDFRLISGDRIGFMPVLVR